MSRESDHSGHVVRIDTVTTREQLDRLYQLAALSSSVYTAYGEYSVTGIEPDGGGRFRVWLTGLGWVVRGPVRGLRREWRAFRP